jgi:hypothetical protein
MEITITLDETTYALMSNEAKVKHLKIEEMIAEAAREKYNPWEMDGNDPMEAEFEAYVQLHSDLYRLYPNQWVAIYGGQLIDHDLDINALESRLALSHPDAVIYVDKVVSQIVTEIVVRSPRFLSEDE